jgi:hypothetical protein
MATHLQWQYYLDEPACRFVLYFIFSATLFLHTFYNILGWLFESRAVSSHITTHVAVQSESRSSN